MCYRHLDDGGLDTLVGVGDDQLDAVQTVADEGAKKVGPKGLGIRVANGEAEEGTAANGIDADGDADGDRDAPTALAHLEVGGTTQRYRHSPSMGWLRKALTLSSISSQRRLTWLLEMPLMPKACTRSSTEPVETPCT